MEEMVSISEPASMIVALEGSEGEGWVSYSEFDILVLIKFLSQFFGGCPRGSLTARLILGWYAHYDNTAQQMGNYKSLLVRSCFTWTVLINLV